MIRRRVAATDDIVGYTYKAENYTPEGLIAELIKDGLAAPAAKDMDPEEALDQIAGANGIDREDEYSFDSDEFPKVVFRDMDPDGEFMDETGNYVKVGSRRVHAVDYSDLAAEDTRDLINEWYALLGDANSSQGTFAALEEELENRGWGVDDASEQLRPLTGRRKAKLTRIAREVKQANPKITQREAAAIVRAAWNRYLPNRRVAGWRASEPGRFVSDFGEVVGIVAAVGDQWYYNLWTDVVGRAPYDQNAGTGGPYSSQEEAQSACEDAASKVTVGG